MITSARNQFSGEVAQARHGAVNDEVILRLAGGQEIVATVTSESASRLGLIAGKKATAMVKATSVIVMVDVDVSKVSARNAVSGKVSDIKKGAVNTDVTITDDAGLAISAIITNSSADRLGLAVGKSAAAVFKASSVIVAVD
jgi:molybdopterin-binding protein